VSDEEMDVEGQIEALNAALRLQQRSVLQYLLTAGSVVGLEFQAHADKLSGFSREELDDAALLVQKVVALGGEPTTEVAPLEFTIEPGDAFDSLIQMERETLETLQAAIEPTGREAASEAVEHRLEHIIMRKQEQVDYLRRARRTP